jgi:hypothetical protein
VLKKIVILKYLSHYTFSNDSIWFPNCTFFCPIGFKNLPKPQLTIDIKSIGWQYPFKSRLAAIASVSMSLTVKLAGLEVQKPFYGLYVYGHNATSCSTDRRSDWSGEKVLVH